MIYKLGFLLLAVAFFSACTSPEGETNYTPADYEFPTAVTLASGNITNGSFDFTYTINGGGEGYYVVVEGGSAAPSNEDVFEGTATALVASGNFNLDGNPVVVTVNDDLCDDTAYDVYAVQFTTDSFLSETTTKLSVTTTENASIAGTWNTVSNGFSGWFGIDVVNEESTVTITDNGDGTFTFNDITAGHYTDYFGQYSASGIILVPGTFTVPCNDISGDINTGFFGCCGDQVIFRGAINFDGTISVHWESTFFEEVIDVVYTKQ